MWQSWTRSCSMELYLGNHVLYQFQRKHITDRNSSIVCCVLSWFEVYLYFQGVFPVSPFNKNQQARPGGLQHLVGQLPTTPSMAKSFDGFGIDAYLWSSTGWGHLHKLKIAVWVSKIVRFILLMVENQLRLVVYLPLFTKVLYTSLVDTVLTPPLTTKKKSSSREDWLFCAFHSFLFCPWQVSYNSTINALELSHAWPTAVLGTRHVDEMETTIEGMIHMWVFPKIGVSQNGWWK